MTTGRIALAFAALASAQGAEPLNAFLAQVDTVSGPALEANATSNSVACKVTAYGFRDNCPPSAEIQWPRSGRSGASGTGTYDDPITFAGAKSHHPPGTIIYVPRLKKYFIMEDDCEECRKEWSNGKGCHVDLWTGPSTMSEASLIWCEDALTKYKDTIVENPAKNLAVDTTPLYHNGQCIVPMEECHDSGTTCGNTCEIPDSASCSAAAQMFGLTLQRFKDLNPNLDCSKNIPSGKSVCMGGTCGDLLAAKEPQAAVAPVEEQVSTTVTCEVTAYGFRDNCPPSAEIAWPRSGRSGASGTGTYDDPITFAGAKANHPPGTKIYVPRLKKYFIMEDDCEECRNEWSSSKKCHVDLWTGPATMSPASLIWCENALTVSKDTIVVNPASNLEVDSTPLYSNGQCSVPMEECHDVGTDCGNSCEIPDDASCAEAAQMFGLTLQRFQELNPDLDCSSTISGGTSVCQGGTCGDLARASEVLRFQ